MPTTEGMLSACDGKTNYVLVGGAHQSNLNLLLTAGIGES